MAEKGGQPGNKNATKDKRLITAALNRAVVQSPDKLRKACEAILDKASEGDLAAFGVIADRLEGKPAQSIVGDPDQPIGISVIERVIKKATDRNG